MIRAIFPGSFDPFTLGHLDVVERAAAIFDEVIVCTLINKEKTSGLLTLNDREEIIRASIQHLPNVRAVQHKHMLIDAVKTYDVDTIVKGVRNGTDFDWEMQLSQINRNIMPVDTILFPSKPEHCHISSTAAREMIRYQQSLEQYLHPKAIEYLANRIDIIPLFDWRE